VAVKRTDSITSWGYELGVHSSDMQVAEKSGAKWPFRLQLNDSTRCASRRLKRGGLAITGTSSA